MHVLVRDRHRVVTVERRPAGEHLERHDAGRVDIGPGVADAGGDLFGRQVRHRAQDDVAGGHGLRADRADQAEVGDLDRPAGRDQHVLRFDVAMHQAGGVRRGQGVQQRVEDGQYHRNRQRTPFPDQVAQGAAVDQFHHQEDQVAVLPLVVHGDHPGMPERGGQPGLAFEPAQEGRVRDILRAHHLHGHRPVQPGVQSAVHRGHSATRDHRAQPVATVEHGAARRTGDHIHN